MHAAHELGAIQTLLITDTLFRVNDVAARRRYSALVEEVEAGGGEVFVFSGALELQSCRESDTPTSEVNSGCGGVLCS